jgi:hypothetical protein
MKRTIIYVPGMKPKPPAAEHRKILWKCLLEGVRRSDAGVVGDMAAMPECFQLVAWSHIFYDTPRDITVDLPGVERILALDGPEDRDIEEARHWHKQIGRLVYLLGDAFPALIKWVAGPNMKINLQDSLRYFENKATVADEIRDLLTSRLASAHESGEKILLIAHSLGSVIAYDVLWELTHRTKSALKIDLLLTVGSPLGLNFVKHRVSGAKKRGRARYPHNIRRWCNLSAIGEMTALDRVFANDYREMLELNLVEEITDRNDLLTYFRGPEGLNVHRCYGYMVNPVLGKVVADWWRDSGGNPS